MCGWYHTPEGDAIAPTTGPEPRYFCRRFHAPTPSRWYRNPQGLVVLAVRKDEATISQTDATDIPLHLEEAPPLRRPGLWVHLVALPPGLQRGAERLHHRIGTVRMQGVGIAPAHRAGRPEPDPFLAHHPPEADQGAAVEIACACA